MSSKVGGGYNPNSRIEEDLISRGVGKFGGGGVAMVKNGEKW